MYILKEKHKESFMICTSKNNTEDFCLHVINL